jgi:hypothetical protein
VQFPDMTVNGITVSQEAQIAALRLFLQNDSRRALNLECFLEDVGVPAWNGLKGDRITPLYVSPEAADRLLKRAKEAGIITFDQQTQRWANDHAAEAFLQGTAA